MIRMIQNKSAAHAKAYFRDALSQSDYYVSDQELPGVINGELAKRLGLSGTIDKKTFDNLCDNINPQTGKTLTSRKFQDRTVGYDVNFHAPKSLSLINSLSPDSHILDAFTASVRETMKEIEADAKVAVRKNGVKDIRPAKEMAWVEFIHQTARPTSDNLPDPHLHCHAFIFNATYDEKENVFKTAQWREIKRDMPFYQARFHKRLSDRLIELGYDIEPKNGSFEVKGVPKKIIEHFSKRTDEIGRFAKEQGIHDPLKLDKVGALTRSKKQKGLTMHELKKSWLAEMRKLSQSISGESLMPLRYNPNRELQVIKDADCINYAVQDSFERASVMNERRFLEKAYRYGIGNASVSVESISKRAALESQLLRVKQGAQTLVTTKKVLKEEMDMVDLAKQGIGKLKPVYEVPPQIKLEDEQQRNAVKHILTTKDRVSIILGAAGTGKTTLMKEAVKHLKSAGKEVVIVAPTAQASRGVLKEDGFKDAETVAKLLADKAMQDKLNNQILWVDEAGLLGTSQMKKLLKLATEKNAQIILGGDTRQHSSVLRGDALRILSTVGKIRAAEVTNIYRQKLPTYKKAVEDLSKGNVKDAFEKLVQLEAVREVDALNPNETLADDYIDAITKGDTAIIISPTHAQCNDVSEKIRSRLKEKGKIGKKEIRAFKFTNRNLTTAQKSDWRQYAPRQVIQFNQNTLKFNKGSIWKITGVTDGEVRLIDQNKNRVKLPLNKCQHFDVYDLSIMKLSKGDSVRITRNGEDNDKKRLNNGMSLKVSSIDRKGNITLRSKKGGQKYKIDRKNGNIAHDYCITSHASQGKTVDQVFIAQPSSTFQATDMKQFYVSVSRGKYKANIYTDDKEMLLEYASEAGNRQSALELVNGKDEQVAFVLEQVRKEKTYEKSKVAVANEFHQTKKTFDREYEPGI